MHRFDDITPMICISEMNRQKEHSLETQSCTLSCLTIIAVIVLDFSGSEQRQFFSIFQWTITSK